MSVKFDKPYPGDWYPKGSGPGKETLPGAENVSLEALRAERGSSAGMESVSGYVNKGAKILPVRPGTTSASRESLLRERGTSASMAGNEKKTY